MKPQELRIGNIVNKLFVDSGSYEWSFFRSDEFKELIEYPNNFKPTPLTSEWLERFGFEKSKYDCYKLGRLTVGYPNCWQEIEVNGQYLDVDFPDCKYVHELQNLYFALTGTELTLKEEENTK